jgi:hypothetical protein
MQFSSQTLELERQISHIWRLIPSLAVAGAYMEIKALQHVNSR